MEIHANQLYYEVTVSEPKIHTDSAPTFWWILMDEVYGKGSKYLGTNNLALGITETFHTKKSDNLLVQPQSDFLK